jgi:Flp pilus assembly protein TadD/predicted Zn-dependent protease with MMP-like domain
VGSRASHAVADADVEEDRTRVTAALELFTKALDGERYDEALACAQVVSRVAPDDATGHLDRALALDSLGQTRGAHLAYQRAVALAPQDPDVLVAAADFLARSGDDDGLETAVLYARRGREAAPAAQGSQLAAIESRALNDLGRPAEALQASESALALDSDDIDATVERAVALFELLRFDEAAKALTNARKLDPKNGRVAWYLGLLSERQGRSAEADALIAEASRLDPDTYPAPLPVPPRDFQKIVDEEVKGLPANERRALASTRFSWADIPDTADLQAGDPVLSPEIVGVYRPGDVGQPDVILLYRRNLLRVAHTPQDLHTEVRDTLLHELGHLHGEDDEELRDRGL